MRYFSTTAEVDVEISEREVKQWAAELYQENLKTDQQIKADLENIYLALRKHGELGLAARLLDIIRQEF